MASKISELTDLGTTPADGDYFAVVDTDASQTKKVSYADLVAGLGGGGFDSNGPSKTLLETIENTSGGSFDFQSIPAGWSRIIISGYVRSVAANTGEAVDIALNNDTTATNYHNQYHAADNGSGADTDIANNTLGISAAGNSPTGAHASISIIIEGYDKAKVQNVQSRLDSLRAAGHVYTAKNAIHWEDGGSTAVTRVTISSASGMTGVLRLYGEM